MTADVAELRDRLSGVLTEIARLGADEGLDVAGIVATALASAAANVGGPETLLAGRPGSWEADLVERLLTGTMGDDPDRWSGFRTEPITVTLNVAELVEAGDLHPGLLGLDEALCRLDKEFDQLPDDDVTIMRYDEATKTIEALYRASYREYADRFTTAVLAISRDRGLTTPPLVRVDADPGSFWWDDGTIRNLPAWDDLLADDLWEAAHSVVPLPNVTIATPRDDR